MIKKPEWAAAKFNDKWARMIGIPVLAFVVLLSGDHPLYSGPFIRLLLAFIRNIICTFFYWEAAKLTLLYVHYRYPQVKNTTKWIFFQIGLFLLLIIIGSALLSFINVFLFDQEESEGLLQEFLNVSEKSLILLGVVMLLYECAYFFNLYQKKLYEAELFKKEAVLVQFNLLKSQIDPHFLFNSLNTLISLIPDDPDKSVEFVQRLSNVYRGVFNLQR